MLTTTIGRFGGRPAITRRADGDDAEALRQELAALLALSELPVPQVLGWVDGPAVVELVTSHLPSVRALTVEHLAAAAAILASAHRRHVAHGQFTAGSVRADAEGRITVDGWLGVAPPSDDVAAVGAVLEQLLVVRGGGGDRRLVLSGLAARARALDPATRPTMTTVAEGIRPRAERPTNGDTEPGDRAAARPARTRPARPLVPSRPAPRSTLLYLGGALTVVAGTLGMASVPRPTPAPAVRAEPAPSAGGSGPTVVIGGRRLRVGEPGDVAVLGRWRCAAGTTPALLQADGSVWVWTRLDGEPELLGTVQGGETIERQTGDDGCELPLVRDRAGHALAINRSPGPTASPPRSPAADPAG